jgi:hypothetical protein
VGITLPPSVSRMSRQCRILSMSGSGFLATDPAARVRFSELPDFLRSIGPGTGSTQPREYI